MLTYMTGSPSPSSNADCRDPDISRTLQQIISSSGALFEHGLRSTASQHQANASLRISDLFTEQTLSLLPGSNARTEGMNRNVIIPNIYSRLQAISLERHGGELL